MKRISSWTPFTLLTRAALLACVGLALSIGMPHTSLAACVGGGTGNGVLEVGEECDDGAQGGNGTNGSTNSCCSTQCTLTKTPDLFVGDLTDTLVYRLGNMHAFAVGTTHSINTHTAVTALWVPGDYQLNGYVIAEIDGQEEQHSVYSGLLTITPDKSGTQPLEYRSQAALALAALDAAILVDAGRGGAIEYSINGRSFRYSFSEAMKMRDWLQGQVASEEGGGGQRKILTRFRSPR